MCPNDVIFFFTYIGTEGEATDFYSALGTKFSSGATKVAKKAAESEAGRSAGKAAVKGAYEGASHDVHDRFTQQGEYSQQTHPQASARPKPKPESKGSRPSHSAPMETGGESGDFYSTLGTKFGSGATKVAKKAAESEAGRSAGRAAVKGAYEGASHDVHDRFTQQGEYSQQTHTQASARPKPTLDSGSHTSHSTSSSKGSAPPPRPSYSTPKHPSSTTKPAPKRKSLPRAQPQKARVYSHRLAKEPDWDQKQLGQALYNFKGEMKCDLEFRKGQVITILTRTEQQFDWWEGKIDDRVGIFPANYIKLLY